MGLIDEAADVSAEKCEDVILSASMPYLNRQMGDTVMAAVIMLILTPIMLDIIDNRARSMAKSEATSVESVELVPTPSVPPSNDRSPK